MSARTAAGRGTARATAGSACALSGCLQRGVLGLLRGSEDGIERGIGGSVGRDLLRGQSADG